MYSKEALKKCGKLWDDKAMKGMDNHSESVLNRNGFDSVMVETPEPLAFDLKSEVNIWSFDIMKTGSHTLTILIVYLRS